MGDPCSALEVRLGITKSPRATCFKTRVLGQGPKICGQSFAQPRESTLSARSPGPGPQ